jgi:HD-GYP domain-containing protein (c-di-GMP phosphodiesterase class II)
MTSDRPYGQAVDVEAALAELKKCAGSQFDPAVVKAFRAELGGSRDPELALEPDAEAEQQPLAAGTADQRHTHRQPAA